MMKTLHKNIKYLYLLLIIALFFGCGSGETAKDPGGTLTIHSPSFPEIQGIVSKVVAYLQEDVAGFNCPLTVDSDTTLSGQCSDIPNGTHTYTLKYIHTDTGVILATTVSAATMEQGQNHDITFPTLSKNYDDDGDGYANVVEIGNGSNPKDPNSYPYNPSDTTSPVTPALSSPTDGSSTSDNTPAFDWTDVTDPSGVTYEIQVDNDSSFSSLAINQVGLTASNYTLTDSLPDGTYYWRVRARDGSGNIASDGYTGNPSGWSEVWSFTINTGQIPSVPTSVTAAAGDGQATISWNAVSEATSYNLYWSTTSGVSKSSYTGKVSNVASPYIHTGLTNGTTYYYVVTAVNSYGESNGSGPPVSAIPQTVSTSGLIAYYPFNGNANDASGNGYNGTVNGAALTTDRIGNANSAYSFDGVNDYIGLSNTNTLNFTSGGFALSAWVKFSNSNTDTMIIGKHIPSYSNGYFLGVGWTNNSSNTFNFFVNNDLRIVTTETYNDGNWHFVTGVYDGTTQYLYVDGALKASQDKTYSSTNNTAITIGGLVGLAYFNGLIDDVRIYNRTLSVSEIQTLYDGQIPSVPTGVTAASGDGQATISWNAVSGATSYNIYWSTTSGVTKSTGTKISNVTSPYVHTGRTNGTAYYYVVTAVNSYGEGGESSQASVTPQATDTTAPTNPTSTSGYSSSSKTATLTSGTWYNYSAPYFEWSGASDSGSGIAGYYVYFGPNSAADPAIAGTYQTSVNYIVSFALTSGTTYFLLIKTKDNTGNTSSGTFNAFTYKYDFIAPDNPITTSACTPYATCFTSADWIYYSTPIFEWSGASDGIGGSGEVGYYVYFGQDSAADPVTAGTYQTSTNYTVSTALNSGSTYYLLIKTKDNAGNIATNTYTAFTYKFDSAPPSNPTSTTGFDNSSKTTSLTSGNWYNYSTPFFEWSGASDSESGIGSYYVYFGKSSAANPATAGGLQASAYYSNTVIGNDGTYYLLIKARDAVGNTASGTYTAFTYKYDSSNPNNSTTSNFINSGAVSTNSTSVTLTLSATDNAGVTGYCAKESSATPSVNDTCWTSITSTTSYSAGVTFTLSSGDGAKTVYVWFKDAAGNVSGVASDSITASSPSAPTGVSATAGAGQVTIIWDAVSGATSYNIYWSTIGGVTKTTGTNISGVTTPYTHTGRVFEITYYYVVTAVNSFGESNQSNQVSAIAQAPALLPKTGQTTCFNDSGTVIACAGTGQDGYLQRGVVWPYPRFLDNGDNTITDNLTGLMWTKDENLPNSNMTWQQALDYVAGMNSGTIPNFGHTDWRLPNINELESLIDAERWAPALPAGHPFLLQNNSCWSSTAYSLNLGGMAWHVDIGDGFILAHYKSENGCVWPVRSGEGVAVVKIPRTGQTTSYSTGDDGYFKEGAPWPTPRFRDNGDSTVTDNLTGLMWTKLGGTSAGTWQQALNYADGMNAGIYPNFGYTDWRLPNRKEIRSLIDYSNNQVALPSGHPFSSLSSGLSAYYWSSTSFARDGSNAWLVNVGGDGSVTYAGYGKSQFAYVWPVRGGN